MEWFAKIFMEASPLKFQFMLTKSFISTEVIPAYIEIGDVRINWKKDIKLLRITIDDELKFDKQDDILCKNEARQMACIDS